MVMSFRNLHEKAIVVPLQMNLEAILVFKRRLNRDKIYVL
jgi:hypothetical protein